MNRLWVYTLGQDDQHCHMLHESAFKNISLLYIVKCNKNLLSRFSLLFSQFSSVAQLCSTLWNPMDCSTPGPPVHHQNPEFTQTHVHRLGDTIQPSHPLWYPSPTFNLSQHQGLFQWVSSSNQVAKVLEFQLQHQSFQASPLGWTGWISLQPKRLSRVFSNTPVQKQQFFTLRSFDFSELFYSFFQSLFHFLPFSVFLSCEYVYTLTFEIIERVTKRNYWKSHKVVSLLWPHGL